MGKFFDTLGMDDWIKLDFPSQFILKIGINLNKMLKNVCIELLTNNQLLLRTLNRANPPLISLDASCNKRAYHM